MSTAKVINVQHPSASTTNIVNDASGNVAVGNNLTVAGSSTITGNETVTGTLTVSGVAVVAAAPTATGNIPFSTNGTTWSSTAKIVQGTAQASTSGTSIDFTSIPSWVKRVTVMFNAMSTNGTSQILVQLGTSGGVVSTGYVSVGFGTSGAALNTVSFTTGFVFQDANSAAESIDGTMTINSFGSNTWAYSAATSRTSTAFGAGAGKIALSGTLDRIRITTVNGTDTFDAGSINILYE